MAEKEVMRFRVWGGRNRWYWEVTDMRGKRLASGSENKNITYVTEKSARQAAVAWIAAHNGTTGDYE